MIRTTLGAILTHTTGVLLTDIDDAWRLQDHVVGRPLMTHARIMPENVVAADLLAQFPMLAEVHPPADLVEGLATREECMKACDGWVTSVAEHLGWSTMPVEVKARAEVGA